MGREVRNNVVQSRYELTDDGQIVGIADYDVEGDRVVFPHTEIDRDRRGQGLGAELVRFALDEVRESGRQVEARCWYVAEFIRDNPEYQELLAA
jgi:predicted GNAT family acetyltransferase